MSVLNPLEKNHQDHKIREASRDAFVYDLRVHACNPQVSLVDEMVLLTGVVNNLMAKKTAERDAIKHRGSLEGKKS